MTPCELHSPLVADMKELKSAIGLDHEGRPMRSDPDTIIGALWLLRTQWRDVKIIITAVLVTILISAAWISTHDASQVKAVAAEINSLRASIANGQIGAVSQQKK